MKYPFLLLLLPFLFACSHAQPDQSAEEEAAIAKLPLPAVESGIENVGSELERVESRIRSVESRRDNYRSQASSDSSKQDAVEGAEAELASLQSKRGALLHRKHLLDGRRRELKGDEESPE